MASLGEWAERVSAWRASGVSAEVFCRGREFAASTLRWYSSRLGKQPERRARSKGTALALTTMPLRRLPATVREESIVVELGGARIHVPNGVDAETLRLVLASLREAQGPR